MTPRKACPPYIYSGELPSCQRKLIKNGQVIIFYQKIQDNLVKVYFTFQHLLTPMGRVLEEPVSPLLVYNSMFDWPLPCSQCSHLALILKQNNPAPPPPPTHTHTQTQIEFFKTCLNTFNLPPTLTSSKISLLFRHSIKALYPLPLAVRKSPKLNICGSVHHA